MLKMTIKRLQRPTSMEKDNGITTFEEIFEVTIKEEWFVLVYCLVKLQVETICNHLCSK